MARSPGPVWHWTAAATSATRAGRLPISTSITLARVQKALVAPPDRPSLQQAASVALILRDQGAGFELLFIQRAARPGDPWAGHMALPGGRWQAGDSDLLVTVEREVLEEVGISLRSEGQVLGRLPSLDARVRGHEVGLVVVPFVFLLTAEPSIRLNEEVDEAVWAELAPLAARDQDTSIVVARDGRETRFPAWVVGERPVWGLTYGILRSFFDLLARTGEG